MYRADLDLIRGIAKKIKENTSQSISKELLDKTEDKKNDEKAVHQSAKTSF